MMFDFLAKIFDSNEKQIRKIAPIIEKVNSLEEYTSSLTDQQLKEKTDEFRKKLGVDLDTARKDLEFDKEQLQSKLMEILPEAFAVVREAAKRVANHRHFEVQLMAGYFLANNKVTELFTGEGKTNAATLAMYLYGLTGKGAHLVTVNDYLARRDGEWNGHVLNALGMSVGIINSGTQYRFVSDEELVALKPENGKELISQRMEEAEKAGRLKLDIMNGSNLIECSKKEAYACDVVYGTNNEFGFDYLRDNMSTTLVDRVQGLLHFAIVDEADSILIDEARTPLIISQNAQASNDMYVQFASLVKGLKPEVDYTVDEKAGAVSLTEEGVDAVEKRLNVENAYADPQIAYHLDNALKAKELYKLDDEYIVREDEILIVDQFTGRALPGRRYSEGLHQAIEAKEGVEVKRESKTLATITLQNYFRLYTYLSGMTGTALTEAEEFANIYKLDVVVIPTNRPVVREDLNDLVYRTAKGKFEAIVEDISEHHEQGQPVLVGTTSVEKSELISKMLEKKGVPHEVLNAKYHEREAHIVKNAGQKGQVTIATNMAGRGTDIALGEGVRELGGLYIIGTERHESRRIDNQLRGRSGRQGDPGKSRFYVSFEDELMRLFGGDRMQMIMGRVGMEDDMPISLGILGRTIENAQKRVEAHNFDIRKSLVEYDDVLNQQRDIIYAQRKKVLEAIEQDLEGHDFKSEQKNLQELIEKTDFTKLDLVAINEDLAGFSIKQPGSWEISVLDQFPGVNRASSYWILKRILESVHLTFSAQLADDQKIDSSEEKRSAAFLRSLIGEELLEIAVKKLGYTTSAKFFDQLFELKKQDQIQSLVAQLTVTAFILHIMEMGVETVGEVGRILILQAIDNYWMEHLDAMADLKGGINMRSLAQRDPLVEYKNEGFMLFERMLSEIDSAVVNRFFKVRIVREQSSLSQAVPVKPEQSLKSEIPGGTQKVKPERVEAKKKVGRNDPCPCGSGKKYKKCHGKNL